jgi:hypothetical protein
MIFFLELLTMSLDKVLLLLLQWVRLVGYFNLITLSHRYIFAHNSEMEGLRELSDVLN